MTELYVVRDEYRILEVFTTKEAAIKYAAGLGEMKDVKIAPVRSRAQEDTPTSIVLPLYESQAYSRGDYGSAVINKYGDNGVSIDFRASRDDGSYGGHVAFQGEYAIELANFILEHVT